MLIAVDVGNSCLKAGAFEGERLVAAVRLRAAGNAPDLAGALGLGGAAVEAVVAVSVNEPALGLFLEGSGRGALVLGRDLPLLVENRCRRPEEVGRDRLVNAAAAHVLVGGAAVVADLGSAVTVDVVSARGAFLGGAIAPGLRALAAGLRERAPGLPAWDGGNPGRALPGSTRAAVRAGVVRGLAGLLERLTRDMEVAAGWGPGELPGLLTGGDAERLLPYLGSRYRHVPHLTLTGVRALFERARGVG